MNTSLKGGIAAGAASLLLLGGAGTYALWSDSISLDGGAVQSGRLDLVETDPSNAAWADISSGTAQPIADIESFRMVPGDTLQFTKSVRVEAEGDNLEATVAPDYDTIAGDDVLRGGQVVVTTRTTVDGAETTTITKTHDGKTLAVTVTFAFLERNGNETQGKALDLSDFALQVEQVR